MARIRSVHPGLWTDEAFVSVSPSARLLFIGILNECDDQGAFEWKPITLKMRLAPADNVSVGELLAELASVLLVARYEVGAASYGAVRNFRHWQKPKKPNCLYPMPAEFRTFSGPKAGGSELPADNDVGGSEPDAAEPHANSELNHDKPQPVPNRFPTSSEISPQMEDGEERRRKRRKESHIPLVPSQNSARNGEDDPDFVAFWLAYPRKDDKGHARKAWKSALQRASPSEIIAGVEAYPFNRDPQYQPLPATWLHGERWQSVATTAPATQIAAPIDRRTAGMMAILNAPSLLPETRDS